MVVTVPCGTVITIESVVCDNGTDNVLQNSTDSKNGSGGVTDTAEKENEAEEVPGWLKEWRKPWVGAQDYNEEDDHSSNSTTSSANILADLVNDGDQVIAAYGGQGGRGNAAARARPHRPAPHTTTHPTPGEHVKLSLELKLIADIALVGVPNVGKSSLLRALSAATPRVGAYPFTTVRPQLGAIDMGPGRPQIIVADVPGIIRGAHLNKGLGHRFLRHIERVRAVAYVVDIGGAQKDEWEQIELLQEELEKYSPRLLSLPWVVIANKIDVIQEDTGWKKVVERLRRRVKKRGGREVVGASAVNHSGIGDIITTFDAMI